MNIEKYQGETECIHLNYFFLNSIKGVFTFVVKKSFLQKYIIHSTFNKILNNYQIDADEVYHLFGFL